MKANYISLLLTSVLVCSFTFVFGQNLTPAQIKAMDQQAYEEAELNIENAMVEYRSIFRQAGTIVTAEREPVEVDTRNSDPSSLKPADISLFKKTSETEPVQKAQQTPTPAVSPKPPKDSKFDLHPAKTTISVPPSSSQFSDYQPEGDKPRKVNNFRAKNGSDHQDAAAKPKSE